MATSESSPFVLSWVPEIEDYYDAFLVESRAKGVQKKRAAFLVAGLLLGIVGLLVKQPPLVICGGMLAITVPYTLIGPVVRQPVRSFWRRFAKLRAPTQVRVVPGEGVFSSVPGFENLSWSRFDGVLETERVFVLRMVRHRTAGFVILAKRGLDSAGDVSRLRDLLIQETGGTVAQGSSRP